MTAWVEVTREQLWGYPSFLQFQLLSKPGTTWTIWLWALAMRVKFSQILKGKTFQKQSSSQSIYLREACKRNPKKWTNFLGDVSQKKHLQYRYRPTRWVLKELFSLYSISEQSLTTKAYHSSSHHIHHWKITPILLKYLISGNLHKNWEDATYGLLYCCGACQESIPADFLRCFYCATHLSGSCQLQISAQTVLSRSTWWPLCWLG